MSTSESKATPSGGDGSTQPDHVAAPAEQAAAPPAPEASAAAADPGDPDEDDLDDLDDMLDDFAAVKVDPKAHSAAAAAPAAATSKAEPTIPTLAGDVPVPELDGISDDEFQKTLQAGMAELMGGLGDFENDVSRIRPRKGGWQTARPSIAR